MPAGYWFRLAAAVKTLTAAVKGQGSLHLTINAQLDFSGRVGQGETAGLDRPGQVGNQPVHAQAVGMRHAAGGQEVVDHEPFLCGDAVKLALVKNADAAVPTALRGQHTASLITA